MGETWDPNEVPQPKLPVDPQQIGKIKDADDQVAALKEAAKQSFLAFGFVTPSLLMYYPCSNPEEHGQAWHVVMMAFPEFDGDEQEVAMIRLSFHEAARQGAGLLVWVSQAVAPGENVANGFISVGAHPETAHQEGNTELLVIESATPKGRTWEAWQVIRSGAGVDLVPDTGWEVSRSFFFDGLPWQV